MAKRDTIHGAFHRDLNLEIERLRNEYKKRGINNLTKLELTAIAAKRSRSTIWSEKKSVDELMRVRGFNVFK